MRTMNCKTLRREIEELDSIELLGFSAANHLKGCEACATFSRDHVKLREMVSSLGIVEAPGDFEFRLRARLAGEKRGVANHSMLGSFSFGVRTAAFATLIAVFGLVLLLVNMRSQNENSLVATGPAPATTTSQTASVEDQVEPLSVAINANPDAPGKASKQSGTAVRRAPRQNSRDMASSTAPVVRPDDLTARNSDFPITASHRSLKVSLDDGSGSSRTISLPTVSFGSQRIVSQGQSPLMASNRGSW